MVLNVDDFDFCLPSHAQGVLEGLADVPAEALVDARRARFARY